MSRIFSIRKDNLRRLSEEHGGAASLSKALGYANGSRLSQLIGARTTEDISEKVARSIEQALKLTEGYLDEGRGLKDEEDAASQVGAALRNLVAELGNETLLKLADDRFGEACALVLHEFRGSGRVDSKFIKRLVRVIGSQ